MLTFLGNTGAIAGALLIYAAACLGAGSTLVRLVAPGDPFGPGVSAGTRVALVALLGLGALAQLWTLLALGGVAIPPVTVAGTLACAVAGVWRGGALLRAAAAELAASARALGRESTAVQALAAVTLAWIGFGATALGRPLSGDPLALHMMVPKVVAATGLLWRELFQPGNEYFGLVGEMTYAGLMAIGGDDAAQISTWLVNLGAAVVLLSICARCGVGARGRVVALTAMFTSTAVLIWIGEGKIDLIANALALAALSCMLPVGSPLPTGRLRLAGLLLGFAVTAKLMLGVCLVVMGAILLGWTELPALIDEVRRARAAAALRALAGRAVTFVGFALLGLAPFFIKNGVLLGAPLAPLLPSDYAQWLVEDQWYGPATVAHIRRWYPIVLTYGEYFAQYGRITVLVLAFLPLSLLLRRPVRLRDSPLTAVTTSAVAAIVVWATLQGDKVVSRYLLPALLLTIPLAAAAAEKATSRDARPRFLGAAVLAACFVTLAITANFATGLYFFPAATSSLLHGMLPECGRDLGWCVSMTAMNRIAPAGARVYSVSSYRYWLRPDLIACSYDFRAPIMVGATAEERWRDLYDKGYAFIVPDRVGTPRTLLDDLKNPPGWVRIERQDLADPASPIAISYDLARGGPSQPPRFACRRNALGNWRVVEVAPPPS